jgi:tetratricopeptide (TPR) repeat protein
MIGGFSMDFRELFSEMNHKLDLLQKKAGADEINEEDTEEELDQLKQQSEFIVEEWLKFEEKLGSFLSMKKNTDSVEDELLFNSKEYEESYKKLLQLDSNDQNPSMKSPVFTKDSEEPDSIEWSKGKALYDLLMFENAIPLLEEVVKNEPDFDPAKYFLSNSYIGIKEYEKAKYYLQFLVDTTEGEDIKHLSLHGLGCVEGLQQDYERALHSFNKISIEDVRDGWRSIFLFNHAQTLFQAKDYEYCLDKLIDFYELEPDDWQGPFLIGKVYHILGDEEAGFSFWFEALQLQQSNKLLKELAKHFHEKTYYQMAIQCYERMIKNDIHSLDEEVWFGLAWNYGLTNQYEKSKGIFHKALSLFPDNLHLQISYVWMLFLWKQNKEGKKALHLLKTRYGNHPLILGLTYLADGEYTDALGLLNHSSH